MQALFQSAQHICEKREGSGSVSLRNGTGSGRPKNMRIRFRIPNTGFRSAPVFIVSSHSRLWHSTAGWRLLVKRSEWEQREDLGPLNIWTIGIIDRTSARPQVNLRLLRKNSKKIHGLDLQTTVKMQIMPVSFLFIPLLSSLHFIMLFICFFHSLCILSSSVFRLLFVFLLITIFLPSTSSTTDLSKYLTC